MLQLLAAGGNAYYLAKFAGIFGLDMQDIGAQQTGMSKDEFKAKLAAAADAESTAREETSAPWPSIVGGITTSHVPAIGRAIARSLQHDPYWKPFFDGFAPGARSGSAEVKPDVLVVFYNDHGLNFFLDKMPTFAVGAAAEYGNADEGWGIPSAGAVQGRAGPVMAPDRIADRRRVRRHDLPGDAGRPRRSRCRWRCSGRDQQAGP